MVASSRIAIIPPPARVVELFRLKPQSLVVGARTVEGLPGAAPATLLVYNPLSAPIYFRFGASDPTAIAHDVACPGQAVMAWPLDPGVDTIRALVVYPGAVPVVDVADAIVRICADRLPAFVGPLA